MVLSRNDHPLGTCCFGRTNPLPAIQFGRIEHIRRLCTMPPFQVGKCIGTEMEEEIVFHIVPGELRGAGLGLGVNTVG